MTFFSAGLGSLTLGMAWFASPLPGYLCDRLGCRITNSLGAALCMTGLVVSSFAKSLTHMYVTHGLIIGLGICFIYNSCYLVIAQYFKKKLSLATGIVALGESTGVFFTGPLLQFLLDSFGWRGTYRIMVVAFALVCLLGLTYNPNIQLQETTGHNIENKNENQDNERSSISLYCSVWKIPTFVVVTISFMVTAFAIYIPLIYLVSLFYIIIGLKKIVAPSLTDFYCDELYQMISRISLESHLLQTANSRVGRGSSKSHEVENVKRVLFYFFVFTS